MNLGVPNTLVFEVSNNCSRLQEVRISYNPSSAYAISGLQNMQIKIQAHQTEEVHFTIVPLLCGHQSIGNLSIFSLRYCQELVTEGTVPEPFILP